MHLNPWHILVTAMAGWMNREQGAVVEYHKEENRILRELLGNKRPRLRYTRARQARRWSRVKVKSEMSATKPLIDKTLFNHGAKPVKSFLFLTAALTFVSLLGCKQDTPSSPSAQQNESEPQLPMDVVNERMSAYNRHDLRAFLNLYSDGIEIFNYPDRSLGKGKEHIRSIFEPMFVEGVVQVAIHYQVSKDSYVVNHETVTYGDTTTEYVSIYEVRDGLIQSVRFVRD